MYQITTTTDISGSAYNELIAYLTRHCDSFSFHLPNMGKMLVNERNAQYFPEYPIGYGRRKRKARFATKPKDEIVSDFGFFTEEYR